MYSASMEVAITGCQSRGYGSQRGWYISAMAVAAALSFLVSPMQKPALYVELVLRDTLYPDLSLPPASLRFAGGAARMRRNRGEEEGRSRAERDERTKRESTRAGIAGEEDANPRTSHSARYPSSSYRAFFLGLLSNKNIFRSNRIDTTDSRIRGIIK